MRSDAIVPTRSRGRLKRAAACVGVLTLAATASVVVAQPAAADDENAATELLATITIPNADDVRGNITLPERVDGVRVTWYSSDPSIVSDEPSGKIAAGEVNRPAVGEPAANVTMTACARVGGESGCRDIELTVRPAVKLAEFTGYGMVSFRGSLERIYGATSVGNDVLSWKAVNNGDAIMISTLGSTGLRDPSIVRSPEGDKFYMVATDLWTRDPQWNAKGGWGWAQTGGSTYIEVWESTDLKNWSNQRHVEVNTSPETGMTFAPEAIWDPEIGQYVVYWTSAIYPEGTYYTPDLTDPNRRDTDQMKWGRNVTYYTTTRDFVNFTPSRVMYDRGSPAGIGTGTWNSGYGNLDAQIFYDPADGYYYRTVQDRWDKVFDYLYPECWPPEQLYTNRTDLYIERSKSILAPAQDWELLGGCLTTDAINKTGIGTVTYQEGSNALKLNPGDVNGPGYVMMADGGWRLANGTQRPGLNPYFTTDISSGKFVVPDKWNPPHFTGDATPRATHGHTLALTAAEHAAFSGQTLVSLELTKPPTKTTYNVGDELDTTGLVVSATYDDGPSKIAIAEGYGGYSVSGFDSSVVGTQLVTVSYTVLDVTKTTTFPVDIGPRSVNITAELGSRCVAGKVTPTVTVSSGETQAVSVTVESEFGSKVLNVAPGKNGFHAFTSRLASVPAGTMSIVATTGSGASAREWPMTLAYPALSCTN